MHATSRSKHGICIPLLWASILWMSPLCQSATAQPVAVARVNGREIFAAEVQRTSDRLPPGIESDQRNAQALEALIQRELVLDALIQKNKRQIVALVEQEVGARAQSLQAKGELLSTACHESGISEHALKRNLAWGFAWPLYVQKNLHAQRLKSYFQQHIAHFDGGRREVAHILWSWSEAPTDDERQSKIKTARQVLKQIRSEEISFADAAREHSKGTTASDGGKLGWIERAGPMTEAFSQAAFDLKPNRISAPIVDGFGVHLIQCLQVEPGDRKFNAAIDDVRQHAQRALFRKLLRQRRQKAEIDYLAEIPAAGSWTPDTVLIPAASVEQ